jgi:ClpP class serine protease
MANPNGSVGSIGVTSSYTDNALKNIKEGITFNQLSMGEHKDMTNEDKLLTWEEKNIMMEAVKEDYESFMLDVSVDRSIPLDSVRKLSDGAPITPSVGLKNKLIDAIGTG